MELKHNNPNSEIVLASELDFVKLFLLKIVKIGLKNEFYNTIKAHVLGNEPQFFNP